MSADATVGLGDAGRVWPLQLAWLVQIDSPPAAPGPTRLILLLAANGPVRLPSAAAAEHLVLAAYAPSAPPVRVTVAPDPLLTVWFPAPLLGGEYVPILPTFCRLAPVAPAELAPAEQGQTCGEEQAEDERGTE